jgi:hypothetical protein
MEPGRAPGRAHVLVRFLRRPSPSEPISRFLVRLPPSPYYFTYELIFFTIAQKYVVYSSVVKHPCYLLQQHKGADDRKDEVSILFECF